MPELPAVETLRQIIEEKVVGIRIMTFEITDPKIYKDSPMLRTMRLTGLHITDTLRRGKYLFLHFSDGKWLLLHFGMTGDILFAKEGDKVLYARMHIAFANHIIMHFADPRKFGKAALLDSAQDYIEEKHLGPDARTIEESAFLSLLKESGQKIKPLLLDQKQLAGIGNWIADEMLFAAKVFPEERAAKIGTMQAKKLYKEMRRIIEQAIQYNTHRGNFPSAYFVNLRREGAACPRCGHAIQKVISGGRSSYFCPHCQPPKNVYF